MYTQMRFYLILPKGRTGVTCMQYFKILLRPKKQIVSVEYCERLIWESFNILRKNGQVYETFQVVRDEGAYAVYVIMPSEDALDLAFCTEETVSAVKDLAAIFLLEVVALGEVISCESSCGCEASSWYMLYTDLGTEESPLVCGDCGKPVPLYKLPAILDKEGQSNFINWQDQFKALQRLDVYNYAHEMTEDAIYNPQSRINKMGRALCRALEKAKSIPVFYHLEQKRSAGAACPVCGREWSRTANTDISTNLCTFCRIAVG